MADYLSAELYKVVHRKYTWIALGLFLGCVVLLTALWWATNSHGGFVPLSGALYTLVMLLSVGLYAPLITTDLVFSEQYKIGTLKNEISYGIPRSRIYLGKLVTAAGIGLVLAFLTLLVYAVLCRVLLPGAVGDWVQIQTFLFRLLGALPLWMGALSLTVAAMFNLAHTIPMMVVVLGCLGGLSSVLRMVMRTGVDWLARGAEMLYHLLLTAPMDVMEVPLWSPAWLGWTWGVGLLWTLGAAAAGLALFARRDIR